MSYNGFQAGATGLALALLAGAAVACPDTNDDGVVDVADTANVFLDWGTDGSANNGDVDGDGVVDVQDLVDVILAWGPYECPTPCGEISFSQNASLEVVAGGSVSCNAGGLHKDNGYYRVFRLSDEGLTPPFDVCSVTIGVDVATAGPDQNGEQPLIIRIYATDEAFDFADTVLGETSTTVKNAAQVLVEFPLAATVGGDAFVVEVFTPEGETVGNSFFIGSNTVPESGPSYIAAPACGLDTPVPLEDIGFPDMHIVMQINGSAGEPNANDACEDAIPFGNNASIFWDNTEASSDGNPSCGMSGSDLWWDYTAPADGTLTVDTCGSTIDTVLELYAGFDCAPTGASLGCSDDDCGLQSLLTIPVLQGDQIKILVAGRDDARGPGVLNVHLEPDLPVPPVNDDCDGAIALEVGEILIGDTTNATGADGPGTPEDAPFCGTSVDAPGVWYQIVGDGTVLTAGLCNGCPDACNTTYDAKLHVYCGPCGGLGCVGGDDDGCGVGQGPSTVTFCSDAGETYYVLVEGWNGATGAFELQITSGAPCDNPICAGANAACETAAAIFGGDAVDDDTCDGAVSSPPPCTGSQTPLQGRWYVYTGDGNTATVSTCDTAFDNVAFGVDVYCAGPSGSECDDLECIGTSSPGCNVFFTQQDFCTVAGNDYYIHVYTRQIDGFEECGAYILEVTSDGAPCDDFTDCDQAGCADPSAATTVIASATLAGPSVLGATQDPNTGVIYALQLFDRTWEAFTFDGASYTSLGSTTFDPDEMIVPPIQDDADPPNDIHAASGITYDHVNGTLWVMVDAFNGDFGNGQGQGWIMYEMNADGSPTGNTIPAAGVGDEAGLAADVEHDPVTDTFWFVDIVGDDLVNISRAGTIIDTIPQTCIDEGEGVFGNGCDISNGILEVLVGSVDAVTADRVVPISQIDGSTLGDCPFTCDSVTDLDPDALGSTFTSGIVRDRLDPTIMHVVGSAVDWIAAVEAAPQPDP